MLEELARSRQTKARCCHLDRKWQAFQEVHDPLGARTLRLVERTANSRCAILEELHRQRRGRERLDAMDELPAESEAHARRRDDGERRRSREPLRDKRIRRYVDLLEVVESDETRATPCERPRDPLPYLALIRRRAEGNAEQRRTDGADDVIGRARARKITEQHRTVVPCHLR